ncbi:MAG: hypothetical protein ACK4PR_14095 [Gammaproteobacteria bacterium]
MARTIKKVAHDLSPLSEAVTELSAIILQLLTAVKPHVQFDDPSISKYFDECIKASGKLAISAKLIKGYVCEVNDEADKENILKD